MEEFEIWKPVNLKSKGIDWGDYYEVSNLGRIRNKETKWVKKIQVREDGYNWLCLVHSEGGKRKMKWVHVARVVGLTFIENPLGLPEIDHINRDKNDCRVENLRWADKSTNAKNRDKRCYEKKPKNIPVAQYTVEGELVAKYSSLSMASKATGVSPVCISRVVNGAKYRKTAGGFVWKRIDNEGNKGKLG